MKRFNFLALFGLIPFVGALASRYPVMLKPRSPGFTRGWPGDNVWENAWLVPESEATKFPFDTMRDINSVVDNGRPPRFASWNVVDTRPKEPVPAEQYAQSIIITETRAWTDREKLYLWQRYPKFREYMA